MLYEVEIEWRAADGTERSIRRVQNAKSPDEAISSVRQYERIGRETVTRALAETAADLFKLDAHGIRDRPAR
jgi:hypothetical protein